jgi:hypothetical protein
METNGKKLSSNHYGPENHNLIGWLIILHNGIINHSNLKQFHERFVMEREWLTNTHYEKIMYVATCLSSCNLILLDIF